MDKMSAFFSALRNIPDYRYDGDNHSFALNQPVFACDRSWTVVEQVQVKPALDSGAATRERFPFDCTLTYTVAIGEGVLNLRFWLVNQDGSLMPFGLGSLHLRTPTNQWQSQKTGQWESIGRAFKWHRPKIEAAFQNQRSLEVNLVDAAAAGHCPNLRLAPTLSAFIAWTLVSQECLKLWAEPRTAQQKQRPEWLITSRFWCVRGTL